MAKRSIGSIDVLQKLDSLMGQEGLDCEGFLAILTLMKVYNRATTLLRADGLHFSFNRWRENDRGRCDAENCDSRSQDVQSA